MNTNLENYRNYLFAEHKSENTIKTYVRNVEKFLAFCNKADADITRDDVKAFKMSRASKSDSTINGEIASIKNYCDYLIEMDILEENPCEDIKRMKVHSKEKQFVTEEDVKALLNVCTNNRDRAVIRFLVGTGLRISEFCNITIKEYKDCIANGTHNITIKGKGRKYRTIFLNDSVIEAVNNYLKFRTDNCDKLFASFNKKGSVLNEDSFNRTLKRYARDAGLTYSNDISCHWLRSSFASILSEKGVPVATISRAMGHSDVRTTMLYIKGNQSQIDNAMNMMNF